MPTVLIYVGAAFPEIAGCFAFWAWLRLSRSPLWLAPGVASLALFAFLPTQNWKDHYHDTQYCGNRCPVAALVSVAACGPETKAPTATTVATDTAAPLSQVGKMVKGKDVSLARSRCKEGKLVLRNNLRRTSSSQNGHSGWTSNSRRALVAA
jgi:hypothetical protein